MNKKLKQQFKITKKQISKGSITSISIFFIVEYCLFQSLRHKEFFCYIGKIISSFKFVRNLASFLPYEVTELIFCYCLAMSYCHPKSISGISFEAVLVPAGREKIILECKWNIKTHNCSNLFVKVILLKFFSKKKCFEKVYKQCVIMM